MRIYEFSDYKRFLNEFIASLPRKGRGQSIALATHLNVQQSVITSILKHDRDFTPEQGLAAAAFFGFDSLASEYFLMLIQLKRADTKALKEFWKTKIVQIRDSQMKLSEVSSENKEITDAEKGIYYSNWYYSAARLALLIPKNRSVDALAKYLGLSRTKTANIIEFFIRTKIVKSDGSLEPTTIATWVGSTSELVNMHRRNWRAKAQEKFTDAQEKDYFLALPLVISEEDSEWFRGEIRTLVDTLLKRTENSPNEVTRCLNLDWFEF